MWATTNSHESLVKILLDHGASSQTRSAKGRTVFDFVNNENQTKIAEILATNPRDSVSTTTTSSFMGRPLTASVSTTSSSAGDCDFYYQSTPENFDHFMAEDAERRQKLLETAMALVGGNLDDDALAEFNGQDNDDLGGENDDDDDDYLETDENEFQWDMCLPAQMFVFSSDDLAHILDTVINGIELPIESRQEICVPANVVFLSARFAHYFSSSELLDEVLDGALTRVGKITKVKKSRALYLSLSRPKTLT